MIAPYKYQPPTYNHQHSSFTHKEMDKNGGETVHLVMIVKVMKIPGFNTLCLCLCNPAQKPTSRPRDKLDGLFIKPQQCRCKPGCTLCLSGLPMIHSSDENFMSWHTCVLQFLHWILSVSSLAKVQLHTCSDAFDGIKQLLSTHEVSLAVKDWFRFDHGKKKHLLKTTVISDQGVSKEYRKKALWVWAWIDQMFSWKQNPYTFVICSPKLLTYIRINKVALRWFYTWSTV